ncbi:MAG: nuclear transport factor 2 family protein [Rhizobiaceae bacterium]
MEGTRALLSDDFCWNAAIDPGDAPFGGRFHGPDAMLQRMTTLAETFEYLQVSPKELLVDGDRAAVRVVMRLQFNLAANHLNSIAAISGTLLMGSAPSSQRCTTQA